MNVGLFSGFLEIQLDNFAASKYSVMSREHVYFETNMKLGAGFSYVADPGGDLYSSALATMGSVARNAQKLGNRALGYITTFRGHLLKALERISAYIVNGQRFMSMVATFGDTTDIIKSISEGPLLRLEARLIELSKTYVVLLSCCADIQAQIGALLQD